MTSHGIHQFFPARDGFFLTGSASRDRLRPVREGAERDMALPQVGVVKASYLRRMYWYGIEVELVSHGYVKIVEDGYLLLKPLPDPDDFKMEVLRDYSHPVSDWFGACRSELHEIAEDIEAAEDPISEEAWARIRYFLENFDFDAPDSYGETMVAVDPSGLVVSCPHRQKKVKLTESNAGRAMECAHILRTCGHFVYGHFADFGAETFRDNCLLVAEDIEATQYP